MSEKAPTRRFRFLIVDDADQEKMPREVFLEIPEMDDYSDESTGDLIREVGIRLQEWYIEHHGFIDPSTRAGTAVE